MTAFVEGVHYRQLGREGGRYRFETLETIRVKLKWRVPAIKFLHRGVEWLRFEDGYIGGVFGDNSISYFTGHVGVSSSHHLFFLFALHQLYGHA